MLYGNLIFIKKTGGDGSKFPVTERDIKIGRSEDCLIRIYNPQVAAEHCQLIIEDNGQMTLRNLSKETVLNGKPLGQGDVTLCHGDIFKVGERLARWEYLPTSKYYRQLLSPTGRLVAVVMPQQRSMGEQATPGTSASQISVLKNTPLGKRRYSERISSGPLAVKRRKSSGTDVIRRGRGDLPKFLTGRHSLKASKLLLHGAKVKERKSISGTISSKTPKGKVVGKSRKSTLPSWKVNIVSPSQRKSASRNSPTKLSKKSGKSPKNAIKTPLTDVFDSESSQNLLPPISKSGLKTPEKIMMVSESSAALSKSASKSISRTPLKAIAESAVKNEGSVRSTRSFSKSPSSRKTSTKSPSKIVSSTPKPKSSNLARLVNSESKLNFRAEGQQVFPKRGKRMSLILERVDSTPGRSFKNLHESVTQRKEKVSEVVSNSLTESLVGRTILNKESPVNEKQTRRSVKGTPAQKTPGKTVKTPRKSSIKKTLKSPTEIKVKTPRKSVIKQAPGNLTQSTCTASILEEVAPEVIVKTLIDLNSPPSSKKTKYTPRKSTKGSPNVKTGNLDNSVGKIKLSASRKISIRQNEISSKSPLDISAAKSPRRSTSPRGRKSEVKEAPLKPTTSSPRGVRRKLSPSSSAERAAKMLKTSSPKKPDKNKKAALLVLGKANRKQLLSQNVKVLLKQKIVKKAIKQSTFTSQKGESRKKTAKGKKVSRKTALTSKKENVGKDKISPPKNSRTLDASSIKSPVKDKMQDVASRGKTLLEASQPSALKAEASPDMTSRGKPLETPGKSPSMQNKNSESSRSITSSRSPAFSSSPSGGYDKTAESYLFNSNRRSKRLSSKNDTGRPDFIELSPTALGLMPKNMNIFKTPKENKRRSSSLVTPKNVRSSGIIKSASTSKIGNRKSVRFSSKDVSYNSDFQNPVTVEKVDFDFSFYHTPDVTVDMFVSPLTDKSSVTKESVSESKSIPSMEDSSKVSPTKVRRSSSGPNTCVRKLLQSPQIRRSKVSSIQKSLPRSSRASAAKSPSPDKLQKARKASRNNLGDLKGVRQLFVTPKKHKSPKNDLTDVRGVKKLLQTPKAQKSPKNDLTDLRGVKKMLQTPKLQKSPKNDLTDVRGVKKLLQTPKAQKSPKNDLTDFRGVKKMLQTPKVQKSPKNDLTDLRGVKKLLRTPKEQKSPKNDLTDVRGVKKLLQTPKAQKSPKNDLTDLRGVKKLLQTPKEQKSPKNDLTDVVGVKKLLGSPRIQKGPKNDLSDLRGVKKLLASPKVQRSPKNDLTDVTGVKKLFTTRRGQKSPKNNLLEVSGLGNLFDSPVQKLSRHSATDVIDSPKPEGNLTADATNVTGVNQLLITKTPESVSKSKKTVSRKSHVKDYRAIRGRRTIYSTPKGPKNDLSDLTGVRELFSRHKPTSDYNISLTGVAELFDFPNSGVDSNSKKGKSRGKSMQFTTEQKTPAKGTPKSKKEFESDEREDKTVTRRGRLRKATEEEIEMRETRSRAAESMDEKKPSKRKGVEKIKTSQAKKPSGVARKSGKVTQKETETVGKKSQAKTKTGSSQAANEVVKSSRKRKVVFEESETPPAKTRRKLPTAEKADSGAAKGTSGRAVSRSRKETVSEEKASVKRVKEVSEKAKNTKTSKKSSKVQSKPAIKTGTKQTQKVQSRSQSSSNSSESKAKASPRKTRSAKSEAVSKTGQKSVSKAQKKTVGKKLVKATAGRGKTSPVVKRSTRRK